MEEMRLGFSLSLIHTLGCILPRQLNVLLVLNAGIFLCVTETKLISLGFKLNCIWIGYGWVLSESSHSWIVIVKQEFLQQFGQTLQIPNFSKLNGNIQTESLSFKGLWIVSLGWRLYDLGGNGEGREEEGLPLHELLTRLLISQLSNVFALSLFRTKWGKNAVSDHSMSSQSWQASLFCWTESLDGKSQECPRFFACSYLCQVSQEEGNAPQLELLGKKNNVFKWSQALWL